MAKIEENFKEEVRVITWDYHCHPDCCYYKECKGFMDKHYRCPQWAQDRPRIETTKQN